jgi:hypothetical protein
MPKRWEQELRRLGDVPAPTERIHARSTRPSEPRPSDGMPPTRQRVLAGVVAFGVFIAAGTFLVRAIDPTRPERAPGTSVSLPTLRMTFVSRGPIDDGSEDSMRRVDTVLDYGDLHEESFTSTLPAGGIVDWVSVDQLTPMFPAPTAGSAVSIQADGDDPRVLIGDPGAWPDSDRFERIDRLPAEPGRYVLVFEADYAEGVARTTRVVDLAAPGAVQVAATEGGELDAVASLLIDGKANDGFLVRSTFTQSDGGDLSAPLLSFSDDDYIEVERGTSLVRDTTTSGFLASLIPIAARDGAGGSLSIDPLPAPAVTFDVAPGRYVLVVRVIWKHGETGRANDGTRGEAVFNFPIEIVEASTASPGLTDRDGGSAATGEPSDVLKVRCADRETTVLTPVVAAQGDGVRVVVEPVGPPAQIQFRQVGITGTFGGSIDADGASHPWPIAPGPTEVQCGPDPSGFEEAATFEVVDPAGHWAEPVLSCGDAGGTEVVGYDGGAAEWVDEPAAIRGILRGVLPDDRVMRPLYGRDRLDRWVIVRDGDVVGLVWFTWVTDASDPRGGGLGRVTGDVCAGIGIDGTVPPRDPDEDGVELDCAASSQVAFRDSSDVTVFGSAEALIRGVVSGIRETDMLVPPQSPTGPNHDEGIWTVEREGKTVASIEYPSLDGITCRFNAIGVPESV